jgi:hypothetical protein
MGGPLNSRKHWAKHSERCASKPMTNGVSGRIGGQRSAQTGGAGLAWTQKPVEASSRPFSAADRTFNGRFGVVSRHDRVLSPPLGSRRKYKYLSFCTMLMWQEACVMGKREGATQPNFTRGRSTCGGRIAQARATRPPRSPAYRSDSHMADITLQRYYSIRRVP